MSAPTKPWVSSARWPRLTSSGEGHAAGVDLQNLLAARLVGDADLDLAVEPAGPAQRGIDRVDAIGRRDDDNLASRLEAVHHGQQL